MISEAVIGSGVFVLGGLTILYLLYKARKEINEMNERNGKS